MMGALRFDSRKAFPYLAAAVAVIALMICAVMAAPNYLKTNSTQGVLDLTRAHVAEHPVKLAGEWEFWWRELLTPEEIRNRLSVDETFRSLDQHPGLLAGLSDG